MGKEEVSGGGGGGGEGVGNPRVVLKYNVIVMGQIVWIPFPKKLILYDTIK